MARRAMAINSSHTLIASLTELWNQRKAFLFSLLSSHFVSPCELPEQVRASFASVKIGLSLRGELRYPLFEADEKL